jgi:hydrogenase maturation factor
VSDPGCGEERCITCSDEGTAMRVLRVDEARALALCAAAGGERATVEIALVDGVAPGDQLLVHAGTALARLEAA